MNSCEIVSFVTAASCAIAKCFEDEELAVLAAVFVQLGDSLATILAQRTLDEKQGRENCEKPCIKQ